MTTSREVSSPPILSVSSDSKNARSPRPGRIMRSIQKLNDCHHFHYPSVELPPIDLKLLGISPTLSKTEADILCTIQISSNSATWKIIRSVAEIFEFDRQLHRCVFERRHSRLEELECTWNVESSQELLRTYFERLSQLTGSIMTCYPVLQFMEIDTRGNHFCPAEHSAINTPAIAAAIVTKEFQGRGPEQLSIRVGDILSIIEMSPSLAGSTWWKAKLTISAPRDVNEDVGQVFRIGYFPSDCVTLFDDKAIPTPSPISARRLPLTAAKRVGELLRKRVRRKEPVFGVDLIVHLERTGKSIPLIIQRCVEAIEKHGIVTGIYRQCGIQSNIQRLRAKFDCGHEPDLSEFAIVRDIYSVSSLLKQYFRQLPNPLFTFQLYNNLLEAYEEKREADKIEMLRRTLDSLPPEHYRTARFLILHLSRLCAQADLTDMTSRNLAIVWAPNLFRAPPSLNDGDSHMLNGLNIHTSLCNFLILHSAKIFIDDQENCSVVFENDDSFLEHSPDLSRIQTSAISIDTEKSNSRWSRFIRGASVEHLIGTFSRRKPNNNESIEDMSESVKWRRSRSTDASSLRTSRSESLLSMMARGAEGIRDGVRNLRHRARSLRPTSGRGSVVTRSSKHELYMQDSFNVSTTSHLSVDTREQSYSRSPTVNRRELSEQIADESSVASVVPERRMVNFNTTVTEHAPEERPLAERSSLVEEWTSDDSRSSSVHLEMSRYDNVSPARDYRNIIRRDSNQRISADLTAAVQ